MKILSPERLQLFFEGIASDYDLRLPLLLADGTRSIGHFGSGPLAMSGGALPAKPTAIFFPQEGLIFCQKGDTLLPPLLPARELFIVGFTPKDLLCLRFIDRFFADGQVDDLYFRLREGSVICGVSGYCGENGALVEPSKGEGDIEFIFDKENWLVEAYSETGRALISVIPSDAAPDALEYIKGTAVEHDNVNEELLIRGAQLLADNLVPESFWIEIGNRCILCSGCNLVCPTCTCFGVQDWRYKDRIERSRIWDSCQFEGFMREAGGHNPMPTEADRTRRRIHHKLAADRLRWGEISCFLCGRCDAVCPTGIGIVAVVRQMVARYDKLSEAP